MAEDAFTNIPFDQLMPFNNGFGNLDIRSEPRYIDGDINKPYIVLINTMVDAEFLIKNLTVNIIPAPPPVVPAGYQDYEYARTAFNFGGTMIIEEPFGVRFGDLLSLTSKKLKSDPERIVFVIKTAFFGFSDTGATSIQQIKPIPIAFLKMDATFTAAGGRYEMEFVTYSNGLANRKEIANVGGVAKFQVVDGKLTTAFEKFADILNTEQKKVNEANPDLTPINYKFVLHDPFTQYSVIESIKSANLNKKEVQFNGSINDSVTVLIEKIMMLSPEVREEFDRVSQTKKGTQTNPKTDRSIFKIYSNVKSNPKEAIVTFHIYPHKVAVLPTPTEEDKDADATILKKKRQDAINFVFNEARERNNLLEYNYIYSGKNIDVIDFEMKLDLFTTYRMYYIEESHIDAKSQVSGDNGAGTNVDGSKSQINLDEPNKAKKLQGIGQQPEHIPSNITDAQEFFKYNQYLSRAVSFSGVSSFLTIAGDPRLYSGYLKSPIDKDGNLIDTANLAKEQQSVMSNWAQLPALVKMNVFMPNPPTAVVQDQTVQQAFAAPFWYDGAFQILSIINTFGEDGRFTQRIEMIQVPCDYNIADLTTYGDTPKGETAGGSSNDALGVSMSKEKTIASQPTIKLSDLTEEQQKCLAHAYTVAFSVGMPPEVLQAIILADSQACKLKIQVVPTGNTVRGVSTLTISRVQNYITSVPSFLDSPLVKGIGLEISTTKQSTEGLRFLLTRNDEFNLTACAKIWIQDRDFWKKQFGPTSKEANLLTERTIVGHNNSSAFDTNNPSSDMQFFTDRGTAIGRVTPDSIASDELILQNTYLKSVQAYYPLVQEFNAKLLPKLLPTSRPNA